MSPQNGKSVLIIIPPYFDINDLVPNNLSTKLPVVTIPYGVLSLASYVTAYSKFTVKFNILDLNMEILKIIEKESRDINYEIKKLIKNYMDESKPDIVGISALFNTSFDYLEIVSNSVKNINSKTLVLIGGGLATNLYSEVLSTFKNIDAACYGEGEIPLLNLVDSPSPQDYIRSSKNWISRQSISEGIVPLHSFVENLDDIPFFDYSLIDIESYGGRALDRSSPSNSQQELSIHTSRGCPFNCVFCSNGKVHGKTVRHMSVEKVTNDVAMMKTNWAMHTLLIEDDHFLSDKKRAKIILKHFIEYKIKIEFPNGMAIYAIDDEIGHLLQVAGVKTVSLAVESGSDFVLKNIIDKPLRVSMVKPAVDILKKHNINVHAFFVIGLPGELESHRDETMQLISDVGFDWVYFFLAIPVAGSRLYEICKENGYLISDSFSRHIITKGNIRAPGIDPEYMEQKAYFMNLEANFVNNNNIRTGHYEKALPYYESIVEKYPHHAFAHYYLAECYERLKITTEKVTTHRESFYKLTSSDEKWNHYSKYFKLI